MALKKEIRQYNHDLLGPLFYRFFYKLFLGQRCQPWDKTQLLFLSRGGIRIRAFYETFLSTNQLTSIIPYDDFYVSRMALIKANLRWSYYMVKWDLLTEYSHFSINDAIQAFLQPEQYEEWLRQGPGCDIHAEINSVLLDDVFQGSSAGANYLRELLEEEHRCYVEYLKEKVGDRTNVILVDTGWSGSILKYMRNLDPERDYLALFFGRYNYTKPDPEWFNRVIGVEAQNSDFDSRIPITSIFINRHLIEGLCEIRWPSVTGYLIGSNRKVEPYEGVAPESRIFPDQNEPHAEGVLQYLQGGQGGMNYEIINQKANNAAKKLCRKLMYPSSRDVPRFSVPARSADFGKNLNVTFFSEPVKPFYRIKAKLLASRDSLWPQGQITLEFGWLRFPIQFVYHRIRFVRKLLRERKGCFFPD